MDRDEAWTLLPGDVAPGDGEVVAGSATVDQSAITGESAAVVREARPGHQFVLAGSRILSGALHVQPLPRTPLRVPPAPAGLLRWWPAAALGLGLILFTLQPPGRGLLDWIALPLLLPPYLLLLAGTARRVLEEAFWRRRRTLPVTPDALVRAARCDTLLLTSGAVWENGGLAAVAFWPLPGVTTRELAAAARQASLYEEAGPGRSVVILAKRSAGVRDGAPFRAPHCGPVAAVACRVAECGGAWPDAARAEERAIALRGGACLGVADGGKPLGLVELRPAETSVTLDDALRAGISLVDVADLGETRERIAELEGAGHRVAVFVESGMPAADLGASFTLAGPAWAGAATAACDLDSQPGKLPELLLGARRFRRAVGALRGAAIAADGGRALGAALVLAALLRGAGPTGLTPPALLAWVALPLALLALAVAAASRPLRPL